MVDVVDDCLDDDEDENMNLVSDEVADVPQQDGKEKRRNLVGFWFLGLFNNFAYVIMLSAAHDLLRENAASGSENVTSGLQSLEDFEFKERDCNPVSTGTILLADILPTIIVKSIAPFLHIKENFKVIVVTILAAGSFIIVSFSGSNAVTYTGVVCASLSSGLGEVTFLSLSHKFEPVVISAWSSGTGGAGVIGAGSYALLTLIGVSPRTAVLLMLGVPLSMVVTFFVVLDPPQQRPSPRRLPGDRAPLVGSYESLYPRMEMREKLATVRGILHYMLPLGGVYFFEYLINQGLFELMYFPASSLTHSQQYRWYQLDYQLGVLISRSSLHFFKIKNIKLLALLQCCIFILCLVQSLYWVVPSIWVVFLVVGVEGLLGGAAYVNTFYRISVETEPQRKEFSLGIASLGDTLGICLAGFFSIALHNWICDIPVL